MTPTSHEPPKVSRRLPVTLGYVSAILWGLAIAWAVAASYIGVLITPLGWTVIAGTTTAAILSMMSPVLYWRAELREERAELIAEVHDLTLALMDLREHFDKRHEEVVSELEALKSRRDVLETAPAKPVRQGTRKRTNSKARQAKRPAKQQAAVQVNGVVQMPNPKIYQLGIAEGERRERERRNGNHPD